MVAAGRYSSPLGELIIADNREGICGIWFQKQKHFEDHWFKELQFDQDTDHIKAAKEWLDAYFRGDNPSMEGIPLSFKGSEFQKKVWRILLTIPYGRVITYGDIAKELEKREGRRMSAQAVGGAVGHNPIGILVPCHRVIGRNGNLTGYAGGIEKKVYLLTLEGCNMDTMYIPKKGTAL